MDKIIILGNGGHARSIVDTIERLGHYEIVGYVVNGESCKQDDYPIIGKDKDLEKIYQSGIRYAAIGIGYLGKGFVRNNLYNHLKRIGYSLPVICDSTAIISNKVIIEEGTFIGKRSIVNAGAHIGKTCIINTGAIVEHDVQIGGFSHVAVGAVLCGGVQIGENTLIGANATVIQERKIGDRCIVGAGEVVRKNIFNGED